MARANLPDDSISLANLIAAQLRQANAALIQLEQSLVVNQGDVSYANQMSDPVRQGRARYGELFNAYRSAHKAVFGMAPDTTGLEQWQLYVDGGQSMRVILSACFELNGYLDFVEKRRKGVLANAQNAAYAANQAANAQQAGDSATAAQWRGIARRHRSLSGLGDDSGAPPPPPIDPTTGLPATTAIPLAPSSAYGPTPTTVFDWGYDPPPNIVAGILGPSISEDVGLAPSSDAEPVSTGAATSGGNYLISDSSISDILQNAMTGTLTPSQAQILQQQEQAALVQAGMDPQTAAQKSASDVNTILKKNNAAPSQSWTAWAEKNWYWLAAAGAGVLILPRLIE